MNSDQIQDLADTQRITGGRAVDMRLQRLSLVDTHLKRHKKLIPMTCETAWGGCEERREI